MTNMNVSSDNMWIVVYIHTAELIMQPYVSTVYVHVIMLQLLMWVTQLYVYNNKNFVKHLYLNALYSVILYK